MKFEYDKIWMVTRRSDDIEYRFRGMVYYSIIDLLNDFSQEGWELVGQIQGVIIVKRLINE